MPKQLKLEIWSDIRCPWCYVGKRHLETALERFPERAEVQIRWRSFELDPSAPAREEPAPYAQRLAKKYGTSVAVAQSRIARIVDVGKVNGIAFDFDRMRGCNTFDAHRLLHHAQAHHKQGELKERLFRAYFSEGAAIGEQATLLRLASEVGLGVEDAQAVLASDQYALEVRADEAEARALGVDGVPFFAIADSYAVAGAQPAALLLQALQLAWSELPEQPESASAESPMCGPEGCT